MKSEKWIELATMLSAIALVVLGFICGISAMKQECEECYDKGYEIYTIMPGETLWSIAIDTQSDTQSDADVRKIVYTIRKDNNIADAGTLQIGQQILLRLEY